jgi:hypothetical protein
MRRLLDDHRPQSAVGGGEGRSHPGGPAADHDDVVVVPRHVEQVIVRRWLYAIDVA